MLHSRHVACDVKSVVLQNKPDAIVILAHFADLLQCVYVCLMYTGSDAIYLLTRVKCLGNILAKLY